MSVSGCSVAGYIELTPVVGIELSDAPQSLIEASSITITRDGDSDGEYPATGVRVLGNADGLRLEGLAVAVAAGDTSSGIEASVAGSVSIANNSIQVTGYGDSLNGIAASGGPLAIDGNQVLVNVVAGLNVRVDETGISCSGSCTIRDNDVQIEHSTTTIGTAGTSTGIWCAGCDEVSRNGAWLLGGSYPYSIGGPRSTYYDAVGMDLDAVLIDSNGIDLGWADTGVGMIASGARIQNNYIGGRSAPTTPPGIPTEIDLPSSSYGLFAGPNTDIHSNTISSGVCTGDNAGVRLSGSGSTLRNNILTGCGYNLLERNTSSDPAALENNDFVGPSYRDEGTTTLSTVAAINALAGASGNFSAPCTSSSHAACVNTGTPTGAPAYDIAGNPRGSPPDVGATQWSDACIGITCSGHGTCQQSVGCTCDAGYAQPSGTSLDCVVDVCASGNGGCDPLTSCSNGPTGAICGACPGGYTGTGATGCSDIDECQTNNGDCDPLTSCTNTPGGRTCGPCPQGYDGTGTTGCTPTGARAFDSFGLGAEHSCGLQPNGSIVCWGRNNFGQSSPPGGSFIAVTAGDDHTCGLRSGGNVECWGNNADGRATPLGGTFVAVSAGGFNTCGLRPDGSIECWGKNQFGESSPPVGDFRYLTMGGQFGCALRTSDSTAVCWGNDGSGQASPPSGSFLTLDAGSEHCCGLYPGGTVACWGNTGTTGTPGGVFEAIGAGGYFSCGLRSTGLIECWGFEYAGRTIPPPATFDFFTTGWGHSCGILSDGTAACWGYNNFGQATPP